MSVPDMQTELRSAGVWGKAGGQPTSTGAAMVSEIGPRPKSSVGHSLTFAIARHS